MDFEKGNAVAYQELLKPSLEMDEAELTAIIGKELSLPRCKADMLLAEVAAARILILRGEAISLSGTRRLIRQIRENLCRPSLQSLLRQVISDLANGVDVCRKEKTNPFETKALRKKGNKLSKWSEMIAFLKAYVGANRKPAFAAQREEVTVKPDDFDFFDEGIEIIEEVKPNN